MQIDNSLWRKCCPACNGGQVHAIGAVPEPASEFSTHRIVLARVPQIWRCRTCGSRFTQNAVPPDVAERLYASGSSAERWSARAFEDAKCPGLIAELDRHVVPGSAVLDIGCGPGALLDHAKAKGAVTSGMDPSVACGQLVAANGHRFAASLDEFAGEKFDVIVAFDVVEHVYDLEGFFGDIARLLKSGGVLAILTGDVDSVEARLCGSRWWYSRYPEHIVFPSRRFFASCPAGLRLERSVRTYASIGYQLPLRSTLRTIAALACRGRYAGLPSLGPDHLLLVLRHD